MDDLPGSLLTSPKSASSGGYNFSHFQIGRQDSPIPHETHGAKYIYSKNEITPSRNTFGQEYASPIPPAIGRRESSRRFTQIPPAFPQPFLFLAIIHLWTKQKRLPGKFIED
jgi:hypothetical protein